VNQFWQQSWFWAGFFPLVGSVGGILLSGWINNRSQRKMERLKIYESDIFKAYNQLYQFIDHAYLYWPPSEPEKEYTKLMESNIFKSVKKNMLYFDPEIRKIIDAMILQYEALGNPEFITSKDFDTFLRQDYLVILGKMKKSIEQRTDNILHE